MGTALKTLLPANFLKGAEHGSTENPPDADNAWMPPGSAGGRPGVSFIYDPVDLARFERYVELLSDGMPTLVSFPLHSAARRFAEFLKSSSRGSVNGVLLYPKSAAAAEWAAWKRLSSDDGVNVVIGAQSSAMAPLRGLSRVIVDDESNNAWRTVRPPIYNVRSLLAKRALLEGASMTLGGRMPSSRAYMRLSAAGSSESSQPRGRKRVILVDLKLAYSPSVKGVCDALAVSEPLLRETDAAARRGAWAIWILDRKGYAGEILCSECGAQLRCGRCGGAMRWEAAAGRTSCVACSSLAPVPDVCPNCSGRLLSARRPGLEALIPLARASVAMWIPVIPFDGKKPLSENANPESGAGLIVGTRAALSLCDDMDVGMIGWIDADGEARSQEYDARARAFGLVWESMWRGANPEERVVLMQTRRPGMDWQRGLGIRSGWRIFWRAELMERSEFNMPPFSPLVKMEVSKPDSDALTEIFESQGFEFWTPDEPSGGKRVIWLRTKRLSSLRRAIEPFFHIRRSRIGYPSVTVWHE
jgi:primosomal protein N' (replication factor Y)